MRIESQETGNQKQEDARERQLRQVYEEPRTARERHYGLMFPSPAAAGQGEGEGPYPPGSESVTEGIELREAHVLDPDRREVEVTVLEAGVSRNGWSYSPSLLQTATPLFEGARAFADSDPYVRGGVFDRVEVKPFRQVFPE